MKKQSNKNYLDFIPHRNSDYEWAEGENGMVTITVRWKGFYHRLAQKVFKRPETSEIALDRYGSFVWKHIDGTRSVFALAGLVEQEFGEEANPVYERLIRFIEILKEHRFIVLKEKESNG